MPPASINLYGDLCTELYERLHPTAPEDELAFYLSYARPDSRILEPLCGSGRFLLPFLQRGFSICGVDLSEPMLGRLREKAPDACVIQADLLAFNPEERFDYIFIPACSIGLFTDRNDLEQVLEKLGRLLAPGGVLVFSVDTTVTRQDSPLPEITASVPLENGMELTLETRYRYDADTQTQYAPGIHTLSAQGRCLRQEEMDFQFHLFRPGEMEQLLQKAGFGKVQIYSSYQRETALSDKTETLLYECRL